MNGHRIRTMLRGLLYAIGGLIALLLIAVLVVRLTNPGPQESPKWQQVADMPRERGEVASANLGSQLVVVGGLYGIGRTSDATYVYEIVRNEWAIGRTLPAPRHHAAAAALEDFVYVAGGAPAATDWTPTRTVWRARPGDPWRASPPMPEGRQGHAMVGVRDHLYVVGGVGRTDRTLIFDASDDRWTTGAALPRGRDHLRAVAWRGEIWAIGGRDDQPLTRVDIYDPRRDRWRRGPDLPLPMSAMAVGIVDDVLHVVGGEDPALLGGAVLHQHFALRRGAERWAELRHPLLPVHGAGFAVYEGQFLVTGGATRPGLLSTLSWTSVTQMFRPEGFPKQLSS